MARSAAARSIETAMRGIRLQTRARQNVPLARVLSTTACSTHCVPFAQQYHTLRGFQRPTTPSIPSTRLTNVARCASSSAKAASDGNLRELPLRAIHEEHGAQFVPFGGYNMPLQYRDQSHLESHHWTRHNASLFDVSHMVQHIFSGPLAEPFLKKITPSTLETLSPGTSTLSCLLNEAGGIIDDTVIARLGPEEFYLVTNAGRRIEDLTFIESELDAFEKDNSAQEQNGITWNILKHAALVALQGPRAAEVLQPLLYDAPGSSTDLKSFHFGQSRTFDLKLPGAETTTPVLISRTGYTGEDGFEISIQQHDDISEGEASQIKITEAILAHDAVRFAGLAARDSLRLEAGMCLYGHDLNEDVTPSEAALGWVVGKERRDAATAGFNGANVICAQLASPKTMKKRRVGLRVEKGAPAREGAEIVDLETQDSLGKVTSGVPSPTLQGQNIAMGYVKNGFHKSGTKLGIKVRNKVRNAEVVKMPFVPNKFYKG